MSIDNSLTQFLADSFITPDWPAPKNIQAFTTTREGGVSDAPYDNLNLGFHVSDDPESVAENVSLVGEVLGGAVQMSWMMQVHGTDVFEAASVENEKSCGDAMYSKQANQACCILTADCLPVLFCDVDGNEVAAAHAGWRGLAAGVLTKTVKQFDAEPSKILAWMGPAIGEEAFEVGEDVKLAFIESLAAVCSVADIEAAFVVQEDGKYMANLYHLARLELEAHGLLSTNIYGGGFCTFTDQRFFSYRRDVTTGRMASVIVKK